MQLSDLKSFIRSLMQTKEERRHALVGPANLWKMKRDFQIQFLKTMGLAPENYLLDIGCGTLRGGLPLISYLEPEHYFGLEARKNVLDEARKELREAGLEEKNPTLMLPNEAPQLLMDQKFDYIWAFSVLMHMSNEVLGDTFEMISNHLEQEGVFYANVNIGKMEEGCWQGFPVVARDFQFYRDMCSAKGLSVVDIGSLREYGHVSGVRSQDEQRLLKIVKRSKAT